MGVKSWRLLRAVMFLAAFVILLGSGCRNEKSKRAVTASAFLKSFFEVQVTWNDIYGSESGFKIERSSDGGKSFVEIGRTGKNITAFGDANTSGIEAPIYRVRGFSSAGDFPVSNEAGAATPWAKTYGGINSDFDAGLPNALHQTSDGGFIAIGSTTSFGAVLTDMWVLKLSATGTVEWERAYGGVGNESGFSIQQTSDGGYIAAGTTNSFGAGNSDIWVLKLTSTGAVTWQKTYGTADFENAFSVVQTSDGGYLVAGNTGVGSIVILKLDAQGTIAWQNLYGAVGSNPTVNAAIQTTDGGYAAFGSVNQNLYMLRLNADGSINWQKEYEPFGNEIGYAMKQTRDGGFVVCGSTTIGAGNGDAWILKLTDSGAVQWQKTYGGGGEDDAFAILQTSDGGYIFAGDTEGFGVGSSDVTAVKLTADGNVSWQKTYGATNGELAFAIEEVSNGGYVLLGQTNSFGAGSGDIWMLKVPDNGGMFFNTTTTAFSTDMTMTVADTAVVPTNGTEAASPAAFVSSDSAGVTTATTATVKKQAP